MSNFNHVQTVTLTIETSNGELHKLVVHEPEPRGGNPRFMAQQVGSAIAELARRAEDTMTTYGPQENLPRYLTLASEGDD